MVKVSLGLSKHNFSLGGLFPQVSFGAKPDENGVALSFSRDTRLILAENRFACHCLPCSSNPCAGVNAVRNTAARLGRAHITCRRGQWGETNWAH